MCIQPKEIETAFPRSTPADASVPPWRRTPINWTSNAASFRPVSPSSAMHKFKACHSLRVCLPTPLLHGAPGHSSCPLPIHTLARLAFVAKLLTISLKLMHAS